MCCEKILMSPNVYKLGDMVYKLFDTKNNTIPNVQLVKEVRGDKYLLEMKAANLTNDGF